MRNICSRRSDSEDKQDEASGENCLREVSRKENSRFRSGILVSFKMLFQEKDSSSSFRNIDERENEGVCKCKYRWTCVAVSRDMFIDNSWKEDESQMASTSP